MYPHWMSLACIVTGIRCQWMILCFSKLGTYIISDNEMALADTQGQTSFIVIVPYLFYSLLEKISLVRHTVDSMILFLR